MTRNLATFDLTVNELKQSSIPLHQIRHGQWAADEMNGNRNEWKELYRKTEAEKSTTKIYLLER